jgi:hypothetical protein
MLGSMGNVFAAEPSLISVLKISGTVVEKGKMSNDEGFIDLKTERGLVKVLVTAETKYSVPGKEEATFADIKVGDRIKVVATRANSSLIANNVTVLPQFVYRPHLLKKAWMELPPKQDKEIWLDMPPQQIKRVLIHLPPQLVKLTLLNVPPQLVKIWIHLESPTN